MELLKVIVVCEGGVLPMTDRQTRLKTIPSRNFVWGGKKTAIEGGRIDFMFFWPHLSSFWIRYCAQSGSAPAETTLHFAKISENYI